MKKTIPLRLLLVLGIMTLAALACEVGALADLNPARPPAAEGQGTDQPDTLLFQDDFSSPISGWDRVSEPDGVTDYVNGVYRIFVNAANTDVWANPDLQFMDVRVEVVATKVGGSDNNDFGVLCRVTDEGNFYFFLISSDGYYGIGKMSAGRQILIGMEAMPPSEKIQKGGGPNHIRADCIGNKLTLYVNGEMIHEVQDDEYIAGDVGLIAGAYDTPGTDIYFDDFTVLKP